MVAGRALRSIDAITARISFTGYRFAFFGVVLLLMGVAGFTLWRQLKVNEQVVDLVTEALERDALIARVRVDALNLENAVDAHIRALNDEQRVAAGDRMQDIFDSINQSTSEYRRNLPPGERVTWTQFLSACQQLTVQVKTAVKYSHRKQAERAREHLVTEIRPITASLDLLADELSQSNAEETTGLLRHLQQLRLRTAFVGTSLGALAIAFSLLVAWRVTSQLHRQEKIIHDQVGELDRRNQELDSFASRVAHDLISPLAPLKGYLTLIRRNAAIDNSEAKELLGLAESSAGRMAEMVEALLRFCRAGTPSEGVVADLDVAVSTLLTEVSQTATMRGVRLIRKLQPHVLVACSAQLLQSIAQNLISNAVKYTAGRPEATVEVDVFSEHNNAILKVKDNGIGMSAISQLSAFDPFFRAPEARGTPGHGLGLSIARRLIEAHHGSIEIISELGVGTEMTVKFPLHLPASAATLPPRMARA